MNTVIEEVTARIIERSRDSRADYLQRMEAARRIGPTRQAISCGNLAHGFAACSPGDKELLTENIKSNIAIISAYNDMLSAHQPYQGYPDQIKQAIKQAGSVAQFAGGVPAMCDGVTQGRGGMELSLFSRDTIAMATGVALSHEMFDGVLCLGICDKIVPGLLIGALAFGHLPAIFIPAGPMPSGLPNSEKARIRQLYATGEVGRDELLAAESASYHSAGTCTFYGTANSNQMLMEIMGVHLPGSSFVNPNTPLRNALTEQAARQILKLTAQGDDYRPLAQVINEKAIVNGIIGLLATGGSTNHTIHLVAIARAAGIQINWDDFSDLSAVIPLLTRIYPNGQADVNHFQAAGGMGLLIASLLDGGLLHEDVVTVSEQSGLSAYRQEPVLQEDQLSWIDAPAESLDADVLTSVEKPFSSEGGLKLLQGNLGRGVIKISAVKPEHRFIEAPAEVFDDQSSLINAFERGELNKDFVAVIRFQGPKANGMPELHKLTPPLGVLQDQGFHVALVTDGRMSGASGKVPAAIHVTPECVDGGPLGRIKTGDVVRLDANSGELAVLVDENEWASRIPQRPDLSANQFGYGRDLFALFRQGVGPAEEGASCLPGLEVSTTRDSEF
ncbi:MAG: phosphogluconate dehydratase [Pseudomonadales bacterium]